MKHFRLPAVPAVAAALMFVLAACGGSDSADATAAAATAATSDPAPTAATAPTAITEGNAPAAPADGATPTPADGASSSGTTDAGAPLPPLVGEWPNRFCVDGVETTLNLRAEPTTDSEILASLSPASCELVVNGVGLEDNFQAVRYTAADGQVEGWVSNNFIALQDPPTRIEAAALLFVEAWQRGIDTTQYSYDVGELPVPITAGRPVLVDGSEGFGCVLVGDVSVECAVALVESDGSEVARLSVGATQRGTDGNDGAPYFADDFPDGPTVTSFAIVGN